MGVALSLVLESAGLLMNYLQTGETSLALSPGWLAGQGNFFDFARRTFAGVSSGADPFSLIALGITVLMLTPYARIVAAVVYYSLERDWKYALITFTVFAIITLGLLFL
ncbi:MAG: DUF1634 domain-containing protein [Thaumarchaeota archaeon]|nr:DUF1634 domain-containing protein [Nitrososphaerota archaeon]